MSKSDQGYRQVRPSRGGGSGRSMTVNTYLRQTKKDYLERLYVRTKTAGILEILGLDGAVPDEDSDIATTIEQGLTEDYDGGSNMTKEDLYYAWSSERVGHQASLRNAGEVKRMNEAELLLAALESATRPSERENLDEGDWLDDPVELLADGGGWGVDTLGAKQFKKHVNICIDNSGSTHMPMTGYCSSALVNVANNLMEVLYAAASLYPGITWDAFSFNRVATPLTGRRGQEHRYELVRQALSQVSVNDPLNADAVETNLAPLMKAILENESERGLSGSPRLDIILTDGDFESQVDADEAANIQRERGDGVSTYVLNLCPEAPSEVALPNQFRVIPLTCLTGTELRKTVDGESLRTSLMRIVVEEIGND